MEDQEFEVEENAAAGTIVGVVIAYDLDVDQSLSYRIAGGNEAGTFLVDGESGHITIGNPSLLDYEQRTVIAFEIAVTDDGDPPLESTATMLVFLKDVNEFSPVVDDQVFQVAAHSPQGTLIGKVQASDPESQQGLVFTIVSGNEASAVSLDRDQGELRVQDENAFSVDTDTQFQFTVQVRDLVIDSRADSAQITIQIVTGSP